MNANLSKNLFAVTCSPCGTVLYVPVPNGWDDVKPLVGRVMEYLGRAYSFSGWNSDRNEAYFKLDNATARLL